MCPIILKGEAIKQLLDSEKTQTIRKPLRVGDKCPTCRKGTLIRGIKKRDVPQLVCLVCGFATDRKDSE